MSKKKSAEDPARLAQAREQSMRVYATSIKKARTLGDGRITITKEDIEGVTSEELAAIARSGEHIKRLYADAAKKVRTPEDDRLSITTEDIEQVSNELIIEDLISLRDDVFNVKTHEIYFKSLIRDARLKAARKDGTHKKRTVDRPC